MAQKILLRWTSSKVHDDNETGGIRFTPLFYLNQQYASIARCIDALYIVSVLFLLYLLNFKFVHFKYTWIGISTVFYFGLRYTLFFTIFLRKSHVTIVSLASLGASFYYNIFSSIHLSLAFMFFLRQIDLGSTRLPDIFFLCLVLGAFLHLISAYYRGHTIVFAENSGVMSTLVDDDLSRERSTRGVSFNICCAVLEVIGLALFMLLKTLNAFRHIPYIYTSVIVSQGLVAFVYGKSASPFLENYEFVHLIFCILYLVVCFILLISECYHLSECEVYIFPVFIILVGIQMLMEARAILMQSKLSTCQKSPYSLETENNQQY